MKTPEDEAFEDIERRQGGFQAKRQMAADKMREPVVQPAPGYCKNCKDYTIEEPLYAQPAQEPVAWVNTGELQGLTLGHYSHVVIYTDESTGRTPLYTTPPQREWVGLTDEEVYMNCPNWLSQEQCKDWIQQIEAKLKEKNNGT